MFDFLTPKIRREVLQYFHENKGFIPFTSSEFIEFLRQNGVKNPIELINVDNFYQFLEGERLEIEAYIRDTLQIIFQYEKYPEKNWNYLGEFFNPCVLNKKEKIALLHEWGMRNPISWLGKNKFMYGYFYANTKVENWQRKKDFFEKIGVNNPVEFLLSNWTIVTDASVESMQKNYDMLVSIFGSEKTLLLIYKTSNFITNSLKDSLPRYERIRTAYFVAPNATFDTLYKRPEIIMKHIVPFEDFDQICKEIDDFKS